MTTDLYETLGVKPDAHISAIKSAYRKLAAKHHPDRGGDEEIFKTISQAWETLKDEDKRAHYDRTGEAPGRQSDGTAEAAQVIAKFFDNWENSVGFQHGLDNFEAHINVDVVGFIKSQAKEALEGAEKAKRQMEAHLERLEALSKRCRGGFAAIVASKTHAAKMRIENEIEPSITAVSKALEMLDDGSWEYIFEEVEQIGGWQAEDYVHTGASSSSSSRMWTSS